MSGGTEIERKFLLDGMPDDAGAATRTSLRQGYLALDGDVEVRLRQAGERCTLTVKGGRGLVRLEEELDLDAPRFEALWPLTEGRRLEKTRYALPLAGGLLCELDEYHGPLAGLLVAEVEFPSPAAAAAFAPPSWLRREVTGDDRYANRTLALADGPP